MFRIERRVEQLAQPRLSAHEQGSPRLRIAVISDLEDAGGAAVAANRIVHGLMGRGHQIMRVVGIPGSGSHPWETTTVRSSLFETRAYRGLTRLMPAAGRGVRSAALERRFSRVLEELQPDVVSLHNMHTARWEPRLIETFTRFAPVVWTLHDMWSFTGRCAYSYDCRLFAEGGCDASCPTAGEYPTLPKALVANAYETRRRAIAALRNLVAVTPSRWLAREAAAGLWPEDRVRVIPYGLPLEVFRPMPREEAQRRLGFEDTRPVLLVVAQFLKERRKGGPALQRLVRELDPRRYRLLTAGSGRLEDVPADLAISELGYLGDPEALRVAYSAADALVHPAPVDNLPNVVLEAMACGTPTVGLPIGGVVDMVRPGQTGWLAPTPDAEGLIAAVRAALTDIESRVDLAQHCRRIAESEYPLDLQARRYEDLFLELIRNSSESERPPSNSEYV